VDVQTGASSGRDRDPRGLDGGTEGGCVRAVPARFRGQPQVGLPRLDTAPKVPASPHVAQAPQGDRARIEAIDGEEITIDARSDRIAEMAGACRCRSASPKHLLDGPPGQSAIDVKFVLVKNAGGDMELARIERRSRALGQAMIARVIRWSIANRVLVLLGAIGLAAVGHVGAAAHAARRAARPVRRAGHRAHQYPGRRRRSSRTR
jgi:hypothetical protein